MKLLLDIYLRAGLRLVKNPPHLRVITNYLKYWLCRLTKRNYVSHTPTNVVIYTTKNCNLSCNFCFIGDDLNPENGKQFELKTGQFQKIMQTDFFKNALRVGLLGGEPFIAKDIFEILEILLEQRKVVTIVTNSMLLKGKQLERLQSLPPDILGLSLYEENRDDVRRVFQAMNKHSIVWIQTIVEATNLSHIEEALQFCESIGCKNLRLSNFYPTYGMEMEKVIFDDNIQFQDLKEQIQKKWGSKINIDWFAPIAREIKAKHCQQPISYVHLDNSGAIGACFMRSPNQEKYGNIFQADAWNQESHIKLRQHMNSKDQNCDPLCRYCENLGEDLYKI